MSKSRTKYPPKCLLDARRRWRASQKQRCMACGVAGGFEGLQTHEIERKSAAPRRWADPCNYLLLCGDCHVVHFAAMEHSEQLALKMIKDPANFSLERWLTIRDPYLRAPDRVTISGVIVGLKRWRKSL